MKRTIYWGILHLQFYESEHPKQCKLVHEITFGSGTIGSSLRKKYQEMCQDWIEKGILPN